MYTRTVQKVSSDASAPVFRRDYFADPLISGTITIREACSSSRESFGRNSMASSGWCFQRQRAVVLGDVTSRYYYPSSRCSSAAARPSRRWRRVACHIINRRGSGCCARRIVPATCTYNYYTARCVRVLPTCAHAQWDRIWILFASRSSLETSNLHSEKENA